MRLMILTLAMLYGMADLLTAQPAAPSLKAIYADFYNGGVALVGVECRASIVPLADSTSLITNTANGAVYVAGVDIDTTSSNANGRVTIKVPLTSDLAPAGCRIRLVYEYRNRTIYDTEAMRPTPHVTATDTTTTCLQKMTGQVGSCP